MRQLFTQTLATVAWVAALAFLPNSALAYECPDFDTELDRLRELEDGATKGALNKEEIACLEKAYAKSAVQTNKNKISRVLLVNAYAYSTTEWARLMERHLQQVDQSDPDLAYLWAFYKFNTAPAENADDVVKWTDTALERRDIWTGDVFVSRVYGLMKLRTMAQMAVWEKAETMVASGGSADEAEALRNAAKTSAREWVDFAKVSGRDPAESLAVCISAATQAKACGVDE